MTPHELISALRDCGSQSLEVTLHYLADRVPEARLLNGARLTDASDVKVWLHELADAARIRDNFRGSTNGSGATCRVSPGAVNVGLPKSAQRAAQPRNWNDCPDCGHVHADAECGFPIGGGRVCRCEREVSV